jgi:hypothetical protein
LRDAGWIGAVLSARPFVLFRSGAGSSAAASRCPCRTDIPECPVSGPLRKVGSRSLPVLEPVVPVSIVDQCPRRSWPPSSTSHERRIRRLVLPPSVLEAAREELARRVALPVPGATEAQRARLQTRLENLRKQHEWGDLTDAAYRAGRDEVERALILLPDPDKIVDLDARRDVLVSMAENLDRATPEQRRELVELLVQRVDIAGGAVVNITWTPAAATFFEAAAAEALAR